MNALFRAFGLCATFIPTAAAAISEANVTSGEVLRRSRGRVRLGSKIFRAALLGDPSHGHFWRGNERQNHCAKENSHRSSPIFDFQSLIKSASVCFARIGATYRQDVRFWPRVDKLI
jgi:hypothetical protein